MLDNQRSFRSGHDNFLDVVRMDDRREPSLPRSQAQLAADFYKEYWAQPPYHGNVEFVGHSLALAGARSETPRSNLNVAHDTPQNNLPSNIATRCAVTDDGGALCLVRGGSYSFWDFI